MNDPLKMHCSICDYPTIILDRDYCFKEFVTVCVECFKKIKPNQ